MFSSLPLADRMKLLIVLALCAMAYASTSDFKKVGEHAVPESPASAPETRNVVLNLLLSQMWSYFRRQIYNGNPSTDTPQLDPYHVDSYNFQMPTGLMNLDVKVINGSSEGLGGFVINSEKLDLNAMTLELDITLPHLLITADLYSLLGDIFNAIPLYGKGESKFELENFRLHGLFHLKQSEDKRAIIIDSIDDASFEMPNLKTTLTGMVGGGDIDPVVSAVVDDVVADYVNRFNRVIAKELAPHLVDSLNIYLAQLNSWQFIMPFI